jgi:phage gpG-like protein
MGSIDTELTPTEARVGTNLFYGPYLEFGTSKMAARPWLLPSFERAKVGVEKELRARLEAKI